MPGACRPRDDVPTPQPGARSRCSSRTLAARCTLACCAVTHHTTASARPAHTGKLRNPSPGERGAHPRFPRRSEATLSKSPNGAGRAPMSRPVAYVRTSSPSAAETRKNLRLEAKAHWCSFPPPGPARGRAASLNTGPARPLSQPNEPPGATAGRPLQAHQRLHLTPPRPCAPSGTRSRQRARIARCPGGTCPHGQPPMRPASSRAREPAGRTDHNVSVSP